MTKKWGESFLKSGLPLEHLTAVTLRKLGWSVEANEEFLRRNEEGAKTWFELDMFASRHVGSRDTELGFLVECKYHEASRFWMFLPDDGGGFLSDAFLLNCGPVQTLRRPTKNTFLDLAPHSTAGVVVSQDGVKQENAIHKAIQQLSHGFAPYLVERLLTFNFHPAPPSLPWATATVPVIVTNAELYRLRPEINDLDVIRQATSPADIADHVGWMWCRHSNSYELRDTNIATIEEQLGRYSDEVKRAPATKECLVGFIDRPHWIAVVNIRALAQMATVVAETFSKVELARVSTVAGRRRKAFR